MSKKAAYSGVGKRQACLGSDSPPAHALDTVEPLLFAARLCMVYSFLDYLMCNPSMKSRINGL